MTPRLTDTQRTEAYARLSRDQGLGWNDTDYAAKFTHSQVRILLAEIDQLRADLANAWEQIDALEDRPTKPLPAADQYGA